MTISRKFNESPCLQDGAYCWQPETASRRFRFGRVYDLRLPHGMANVLWEIGWPDYRRERAGRVVREVERAKARGQFLSLKVLEHRYRWINNCSDFDRVPAVDLLPLSHEVGGFVLDVLKRAKQHRSDLKFQWLTEFSLEFQLELLVAGEVADLDPDCAFAEILECVAALLFAERAP